ncbi:MAG: hypothetical protein Q4B42_03005 [Oscillospiraceae bacterium]|nr:hypothetical protein [Oscillospiraceae bacterium]
MSENSARYLRKYEFKRFKLGLLRFGIYAGGIFLLTLALALVARASLLLTLPSCMGATPVGVCCICVAVSLAACALKLIIDPKILLLDTLRSNALNLLCKFGAGKTALALARPFVALWGHLRVYFAAFALSLALGFALSDGSSQAGVLDILRIFALGIFSLLILIMPALFVGTLLTNRAAGSLAALVGGALVLLLMYNSGFFAVIDEASLIAAVRGITGFSLSSAILIGFVFLLFFGGGAFLLCSRRLSDYDEEELDSDDLIGLGVSKDIAVYELEDDKLSLIISGPEINGFGDRLPEYTVEEDGSLRVIDSSGKRRSAKERPVELKGKGGKSAAKRRAKRGEDEED